MNPMYVKLMLGAMYVGTGVAATMMVAALSAYAMSSTL